MTYDVERPAGSGVARDVAVRPPSHGGADPVSAGPAMTDGRSVTVMRLDTLWSIAERELGDGERWADIAQLNEGRVMTDGSTFVSADHIKPGWQLLVPSTAGNPLPREQQVEVHAGDSLSLISQRELGDGDDWPEVYDLNRKTIGSDPDLILPGQVLQLPVARDFSPTRPDPTPATTTPGSHGDDHRTQAPRMSRADLASTGDGTEHRRPSWRLAPARPHRIRLATEPRAKPLGLTTGPRTSAFFARYWPRRCVSRLGRSHSCSSTVAASSGTEG